LLGGPKWLNVGEKLFEQLGWDDQLGIKMSSKTAGENENKSPTSKLNST
jgi:hypothetical protein